MPRTNITSRLRSQGFTLVELLTVIAVLMIVMVLLIPALNPLKGAGDVTKAAYEVAGTLERARSHAMAHNTHVWVGFYEENASNPAESNDPPPYSGVGRIFVATVASNDGSKIYEESAPSAQLPDARISAVGNVQTISNVHLVDLGAPTGGDPATLQGRPDTAYTYGDSPTETARNRISSESAITARFPFVVGDYTFQKTLLFTPRGEVNVSGTTGYSLRPIVEIGMLPTHGDAVDVNSENKVAIQITGLGGNVIIYRP